MNLSRKILGAAASVLVLTLCLSACGGDGDTSSAGGDSSASGGASSGTGGSDLTQASFVSTVSDAQAEARTSHVKMTIGAGAQTVTADADVRVGDTVADTQMAMTMDLGETRGEQGLGTVEIRLVDKKFYINMGSMTQGKFMQSDLDDPDDPVARQFSSLTAQLDPSKQLASFGDAVRALKKKGQPRELDGVQTQPYEMVLDTEKIAGFTGLTAGAGLPKTLTYTMFIGPDELPRRMSADIAGGTITVDYSQWGEKVDIEAPAADEISDMDPKSLGSAA